MINIRTSHSFGFEAYLKEPYRSIYEIGVTNGLRISDIIMLPKTALKIQKPTIHEQKTGKSKRLYIPVKTRKKLIEFADKSKNDFIFYSSQSKTGHITRQAVFKAFKKASEKAGAVENVATHTMRKNYAYKDFTKSKDLTKLQKKLNHSNASETALYLL